MATIEISSGEVLDISFPQLSKVTVKDIYVSLSKLCRFNGHCSEFYSVADHSINCVLAARHLGLDFNTTRLCLCHDFSEIILGDIPNPARQLLPDYCKLENEIDLLFSRRFDLKGDYDLMKSVDYAMAKHEASYLMPSKGVGGRWDQITLDIKLKSDLYYGLQQEPVNSDTFLAYCDYYEVV
jgi:hypothetical protein